ncbi:hypothetical protein LOTGIDRAFT_219556 [Lottia gigantea]|uniref:UmuC domain-containing protein n=1 Tax=Lottia gigantea TaxID=225164 RepID=V4BHI9_LOTGI|nr:hypothetical protein LOTGIDRAFT_219556 [Lottia gigantea]ESO88179.1 hypothetical protein LOTGIDRAFT_219556 [Lottia gigantea]
MDFEDSDEGDEDWSKPVNDGDGSFCSNTRNSPKVSDLNFPKKISTDIEHPRTIIHIDMDCFYAQVEMIRNPSLRHVPLGIQQKHIIVTCNYPARAIGVTKLMTIKDAKTKCPSLIMVSGEDLTEYRKMSYKISEYLLKYTKKIERLGFDENFLDVSELVNSRVSKESPSQFSGHLYGIQDNKADLSGLKQCGCGCYQRIMLASNIAQEIRDGLYNDLGITCCAGISYNKLLAKLAGEKHKPNKQTTLLPEFTLQLLHSLPSTRNIPGIGYGMSKRLRVLDIDSVLDLYNYNQEKLITEFGQQTAKFLKDISAGIDHTPVVRYGLPQSISDEDSYRDLNNIKDIEKEIDILVDNVLKRVVEDGRNPQTLRVTIRKSILKDDKLVIDYGNRESRQCPLSQTIFNNKDTSTWKTPIVELAISLLNKMVDVTKPFHLTLINICFTKFLKTCSKDISTFFSSPNSKPTNSENDEFFTQRTSSSTKISPAKGIESFFANNPTLNFHKEKRDIKAVGRQNGMVGFFKNGGKRKESESNKNNDDSKRAKLDTIFLLTHQSHQFLIHQNYKI